MLQEDDLHLCVSRRNLIKYMTPCETYLKSVHPQPCTRDRLLTVLWKPSGNDVHVLCSTNMLTQSPLKFGRVQSCTSVPNGATSYKLVVGAIVSPCFVIGTYVSAPAGRQR